MGRQHQALIATLLVIVLIGRLSIASGQAAVAPGGMQWQPTLEDAKRVAAQTNRMVLVHFWSPSCAPCLQLDQTVFSQPLVQQVIQARFVPVKLNADDWPTTVKYFGVTRLPTDLVITPGGQIVGRMLSPPTAEAYLQQLNIAASGTGPAASPPGASYATGTPAPAAAPFAQPAAVPPRYGMETQQTATGAMTAQNAAAPNASPPAVAAYADSRYAEFYQRFGGPSASGGMANSAGDSAAMPNGPATVQTPQNYQSAPNPYSGDGRYAPPPAATAPSPGISNQMATQPNWSAQIPAPAAGTVNPAASSPSTSASSAPPLGLDGYSPVSLVEQQRWQLGDRRWGAIHRGRTYLFTGPEEQQKFLVNPDRYSPVLSGADPVVALDYGKEIEGKRQFGVVYQNRIYLFSSDASRRIFSDGQNAKRYSAEVMQAENPSRTTLR